MTKPIVSASSARACGSEIPSCSATLYAHQRGPLRTALSRGHAAHGVVRMDHVVKADRLSSPVCFDLYPVVSSLNLAGRFAPSFSHSHRRRGFVLRTSARRAGAVSLPPRIGRLSMQRRGSSPVAAHALPVEPGVQAIAHRVVHLSKRPFSRASLAGSNNASKWSQARGKVVQGRGRFIQGGGGRD